MLFVPPMTLWTVVVAPLALPLIAITPLRTTGAPFGSIGTVWCSASPVLCTSRLVGLCPSVTRNNRVVLRVILDNKVALIAAIPNGLLIVAPFERRIFG